MKAIKNSPGNLKIIQQIPAREKLFRFAPTSAMREFSNGALLLDLSEARLFCLNPFEQYILFQLDGKQRLIDIVPEAARKFGILGEDALQETIAFCGRLFGAGILEEIGGDNCSAQGGNMNTGTYLQNPDVVIRDEDEGGVLLFEPDSGQIRLLNRTGLFIWKLCDGARNLDAIQAEMQGNFNDAPEQELRADIMEFIEGMIQAGFIGLKETLPIA
jgi:hypothetical protein